VRRPHIFAALAAGLVVSSLPVAAHADTTLTQNALAVRVSGTTVTAVANVGASASTRVDAYGLCTTDTEGTPSTLSQGQAATILTTGLTTRARVQLPAGTYSIVPCVTEDGRTSSVGTAKTVTVGSTDSRVLFSDDFTGSAGAKPDAAKWGEWSACTYNGSAAYGNVKCGERATLDGDGHLSIPATPTTGTSLSTKDSFAFTYGTMTARMKVPTQAGYWPAFWALNNNPDGSDASVIGEIDAHESYTGLAEYYHVAVHNYSNESWSGAMDPACGRDHLFGEWHDYSARVEPGRVSFYFDGTMCGTYVQKAEGNGKPWAFGPDTTQGLWPILTLAVGGAGGQQDGRAVAPAELLVDRVTVTSL
jgi:hypothetical protein